MTTEIGYALGVLLVALVLFVRGRFPPDGIALGILLALVLGQVLTPRQAFQAFGNEALVTVAAMFVLAAGLIRTGAVDFLGRQVLRSSRGSPVRVLMGLMASAALCSAFVNNTPIVVVFLPIALGLAEKTGLPASKLLIPLAYATIVGGMCTLIGTSTNVLVSSVLPQYGLEPLSLFEPLPLALPGAVLTMAYLATIGRRLLPARRVLATGTVAGRIVDYVTELEVTPGGPLVGESLARALANGAPGVRVLQVIRAGEILDADPELRLAEGDTLLVKGEVNELLVLQRSEGLSLPAELKAAGFRARSRDVTLAELLIRPPSTAVGERVRDLNLHTRHGVSVLAVQRHGHHVREKVSDLRLRVGDILLVQADASILESLREARNFLLLETVGEQVKLPERAWLALSAVLAVILLATLDLPRLPISVLAVGAAVIMVSGGCLSLRDAYRAVDLPILVLMAGTICLGLGLEQSGAAAWIAGELTRAAAPLGDLGLLSVVYLMTNLLTALISNSGAALLMLPIALQVAHQSGMEVEPFVMAILFAASIDFSTPIGYQVNTIVYGPGGYRFTDYVRVGLPLNVLWWLMATLLLPLFWPLRTAG